MTENPLVSIVIVTWNRREILRRALVSLQALDYRPLEFVVVDNGSTDGTPAMIQSDFPAVRVLAQRENIGASGARNVGINAAEGEYVLFADSDVSCPDPTVLTKMMDRLRAEPNCAGTGPIIYSDWETRAVWIRGGYLYHMFFDTGRSRHEADDPDFLSTCFWLAPKAALVHAGGFDPFYQYLYEDLDLCLRLKRLGYHFAVVEAGMWHHLDSSGRTYADERRRRRLSEYRRCYYEIKNYGWRAYAKTGWHLLTDGNYRRNVYGEESDLGEFFRFFVWHPLCMLRHARTIRRHRNLDFLSRT